MLLAQISLTLSCHFSLSFIASGRYLGYIPYPLIAAECMFGVCLVMCVSQREREREKESMGVCVCVCERNREREREIERN